MLRLAGTRARQFSPHAYYLLSDCAFVGRVLDIAGLEPGYHLANELGLRRRYAVLMNASRKRRIERVPIVPRRNARAAVAALLSGTCKPLKNPYCRSKRSTSARRTSTSAAVTATPSAGSTIHRKSSPAFTQRIANVGLGAPFLLNSGSRFAASTSARLDSVSDGPVFTGGKAIESASNPSVDQPITSNGMTDQRIAISVRE